MTNGEFQGKYVQFNIAPNSGKSDQWIVSEPLVHEIASHHIMATPHETGLTAPLNERHIPLNAQEPSLLSRQRHAQQTYTSYVTTYQYPNSSVTPNQECPPDAEPITIESHFGFNSKQPAVSVKRDYLH